MGVEEYVAIRKRAEEGDAESQSQLGTLFLQGMGTQVNHEEAVKWFRQAAEQGHALSQNQLAMMHARGQGVAQNHEEAVHWLRRAVEQGQPNALLNLGRMYEEGWGVKQDFAQAAQLFRAAADKGLREAQCSLGLLYYEGLGVQQNFKEAEKLYRKAAEQGDTLGQNRMGMLHVRGHGVAQSYEDALRWFRKAVEQGQANAQRNLAVMYENGWGVEQDLAEAERLYRAAADQGLKEAEEDLKRISRQATSSMPEEPITNNESGVRDSADSSGGKFPSKGGSAKGSGMELLALLAMMVVPPWLVAGWLTNSWVAFAVVFPIVGAVCFLFYGFNASAFKDTSPVRRALVLLAVCAAFLVADWAGLKHFRVPPVKTTEVSSSAHPEDTQGLVPVKADQRANASPLALKSLIDKVQQEAIGLFELIRTDRKWTYTAIVVITLFLVVLCRTMLIEVIVSGFLGLIKSIPGVVVVSIILLVLGSFHQDGLPPFKETVNRLANLASIVLVLGWFYGWGAYTCSKIYTDTASTGVKIIFSIRMFFSVLVLGPIIFYLPNLLGKYGITSFPYVSFDHSLGVSLLMTGILFAAGCGLAYEARTLQAGKEAETGPNEPQQPHD